MKKSQTEILLKGLYTSFDCRALFSMVELFSIAELELFSVDLEILLYIIWRMKWRFRVVCVQCVAVINSSIVGRRQKFESSLRFLSQFLNKFAHQSHVLVPPFCQPEISSKYTFRLNVVPQINCLLSGHTLRANFAFRYWKCVKSWLFFSDKAS